MNEAYPRMYLYRRIVQAKIYIDAYYGSDLDIDNIADEACFSKFHFIRLFKEIYGKTPHQYLVDVRIHHACTLLATGTSVTDTCYKVGFESVGSFSSLFSKVTGFSPSRYAANKLLMKEAIQEVPLQFIPGCFTDKNGYNNSNFQEA
ncbi:MAG TPA: AraC family transcriptional regulator [Flavitalea sp.]|nr:AraC family transcriptional regulator [Flavitalea sp.]